MELREYTSALRRMTIGEIRCVAAELHARSLAPADEVAWWRAHITLDNAIRAGRSGRAASLAAVAASQAVVAVADDADVVLPDPDVTWVARAAADVARAIVAGDPVRHVLDQLLECWPTNVIGLRPVLASVAAGGESRLPTRPPARGTGRGLLRSWR